MDTLSEILSSQELADIIGAPSAKKQIRWLAEHGWNYELNAARKPIVGRIYARLKLAGVKPNSTAAVEEPWQLDLRDVS